MTRLIIHEAKVYLSRYLNRLAAGGTTIPRKAILPIAEIRPLPVRRTEPRPFGLAKGEFIIPAGFYDPLPEEILAAFEGGAD